ncbi:hypothetical protein ACFQ10_45395 [Streptomyces indonesiensis]
MVVSFGVSAGESGADGPAAAVCPAGGRAAVVREVRRLRQPRCYGRCGGYGSS